MRALLLLVSASLLVGGCVTEEGPDTSSEEPAAVFFEDDRIKIEDLGAVEIEAPTLDKAAPWTLGEWWDIELTEFFSGQVMTSTRVVAGAEEADYLVGMPTHDFSNGLMVMHIPGFGQVSKQDNSYEIHDCRFQPLKFPLALDSNWTTQFECRDVEATVIEVTPTTATVELIGPNDHITLAYDAEQRQIVHFLNEGYGEYRVTGHGFSFHSEKTGMDGLVTVPHMHDVIFMHGRAVGVLGGPTPVGPLNTGAPTDEIQVDTTYDRVSFVMATGNIYGLVPNGLGSSIPVGGFYRLTATAPDGTEYVLEQPPTDPSPFVIEFLKHDNPGGTWTLEHIATGPGITSAEGIAYHVYDVELPTGRILPSIGEHQHGTDDGH